MDAALACQVAVSGSIRSTRNVHHLIDACLKMHMPKLALANHGRGGGYHMVPTLVTHCVAKLDEETTLVLDPAVTTRDAAAFAQRLVDGHVLDGHQPSTIAAVAVLCTVMPALGDLVPVGFVVGAVSRAAVISPSTLERARCKVFGATGTIP